MPPNSLILSSALLFVAKTPQLPLQGQLVFWLLPAMKAPRETIAQILAAELGRAVEWRTGESGKPAIKGEPLSISWSHTRLLTLLAMRKSGALGVDLEGPRIISPRILQRCYTPAERALCLQEIAARNGRYSQYLVLERSLRKSDWARNFVWSTAHRLQRSAVKAICFR